ncbi:MAG: hypothetical protein M1617_04115 [Actinobacteria bacterium]|nr:hypothetical protein [Actinomycetota bacterium]
MSSSRASIDPLLTRRTAKNLTSGSPGHSSWRVSSADTMWARAQAELIAIEAEKQAEDAAETIRVRNLTDANIEVEIVSARSKTQLTALVEAAEARFDDAVTAVVLELTGGR